MKKLYDKIYREFFYIPKHAKVSDRVFKTRTTLSMLTILACCIIFCSTTFAWFTSNQRSEVAPITAASYSLSIAIDGQTIGTSDNTKNISYTCPLTTDDKHTVVITPAGTAQTGYCVIDAGGKTYSTVQIGKGASLSLTIQAEKGEEIKFSANWGAYEGSQTTYDNESCIEISTTPYKLYTVVEGVTLDEIATHYGVSASDILIFNGITEITAGMEIKIPNTTVTEPLVVADDTHYELYTVAEGVTIKMLAEHYGVSADDILSFNDITVLTVGETIKIPNPKVTDPFELPDEEPTSEPTEETATPSDATESTEPSEEEPTVSDGDVTEPTTEPSEESTEATTEPTTPAETLPAPTEPPVVETTAPQETEAAPEPEPTSAPEPSTEVSIEPEAEPEPDTETTGEDTP